MFKYYLVNPNRSITGFRLVALISMRTSSTLVVAVIFRCYCISILGDFYAFSSEFEFSSITHKCEPWDVRRMVRIHFLCAKRKGSIQPEWVKLNLLAQREGFEPSCGVIHKLISSPFGNLEVNEQYYPNLAIYKSLFSND